MSQEVMKKVPDGYREATSAEINELTQIGLEVQLTNSDLARFRAELETAKMRLERATEKARSVDRRNKEFQRKLGLKGLPGDILTEGDDVFILAEEKKRVLPEGVKVERVPVPGRFKKLKN